MLPERLFSLATARGVNLDAVSRGGEPEWTANDVALAAAGLPRHAFLAAMFTLAGDNSAWASIRTWLLEHLLAERERHGWARRVENLQGQRVAFAEDLVSLFLVEERQPAPFQLAPGLRATLLGIEAETWRRSVSHQWAAIAGEYHRALLDAEDHVRRRTRLTD